MFNSIFALSTAAALSVATLTGPATAAEQTLSAGAVQVPTIIGAAYQDKSVARDAVEVRRQGGFATAGAVRWLAQPENLTNAQAAYAAPVIGARNVDRNVAANSQDVLRQGGFATAGGVRWIKTPVSAVEAKAPATVGAL